MLTDMCACTPICDPLQLTCPSGSSCQFQKSAAGFGEGGEFVCAQTIAAQDQGGPCLDDWQCSDGLSCVLAEQVSGCEAGSCCTPYCDLQGPDTCPDPLTQECIALAGLWGEYPEEPGPEFAHIGACVVP